MKEFYHVTLKKNELKILNEGLIPQIGDFSSMAGESVKSIFLFRSIEDLDNALSNWLGEEFDDKYGEDCPLVVFKISLPENIWVDNNEFESTYYDIIDPKYIEVLRYE